VQVVGCGALPFHRLRPLMAQGGVVISPALRPAVAVASLRANRAGRPLPSGNGHRTSLSSTGRPALSPFFGRWRRALPFMPKALACGSVTAMSLASSASVMPPSSGSLLSLAPAKSCAQPGGQPDARQAALAGPLRASRSGRRLPLR
jgi:hypothetical protein